MQHPCSFRTRLASFYIVRRVLICVDDNGATSGGRARRRWDDSGAMSARHKQLSRDHAAGIFAPRRANARSADEYVGEAASPCDRLLFLNSITETVGLP